MISKEENKAIEKFKRKIERADKDILKFSDVYTTLDIHNLRLLLNLVEKQQKEIEELKKSRIILYINKVKELKKIQNFLSLYISKDKIREKIKEKQDRINKLHPASDIVIIDDLENQIDCYKELLKENNND